MSEWCVFHIPSSEYIYCHMASSRMFMLPSIREKASGLLQVTEEHHAYLLPPGVPLTYDSMSKFFRSNDEAFLLKLIKDEIEGDSQHWENRSMEEFELHPFHIGLIAKDQLWREFSKTGQMLTASEKANGR